MAEVRGSDFILKQATTPTGDTYVTVAKLKSLKISQTKSAVDTTSKDDAGYTNLLPGGGKRTFSAEGDGWLLAGDATHTRLRQAAYGSKVANGYVRFGANPSDDDNFVFNGVTWTFKSSGATGNQVNIGANLAATLTSLVAALNASTNASISVARYSVASSSASNDTVWIEYKDGGTSGNAYTLADGTQGASNTTPSGSTLSNGADEDVHWNFQIVYGTIEYTGSFHVDSLDETGAFEDAIGYSFKLTADGAITVT